MFILKMTKASVSAYFINKKKQQHININMQPSSEKACLTDAKIHKVTCFLWKGLESESPMLEPNKKHTHK